MNSSKQKETYDDECESPSFDSLDATREWISGKSWRDIGDRFRNAALALGFKEETWEGGKILSTDVRYVIFVFSFVSDFCESCFSHRIVIVSDPGRCFVPRNPRVPRVPGSKLKGMRR